MRKSASRSKRARFKFPAMFKIVPIRRKAKPRRRARTLLGADVGPCPEGCTLGGSVSIGGVAYWICVDADGVVILVKKN